MEKIMKPYYWIGICAIVGSVIGTALNYFFPDISAFSTATGTIVGVATGTAIYANQKAEDRNDNNHDNHEDD